jgi:hemoglobin-like flavoprotein
MVLAASTTQEHTQAVANEVDYDDVISVQESWQCLKDDLNRQSSLQGSSDDQNKRRDDYYQKQLGETLYRKIVEMCFFEHKDPRLETTSAGRSATDKENNVTVHRNNRRTSTAADDDSRSCATTKSSYDPFLEIKTSTFLRMLDSVIKLLGPKHDHMTASLKDLGRKHLQYEVMADDYGLIGDALIYTLQKHMTSWDEQLETSWRSVYSFISTTMLEGAQEAIANRIRPPKSVGGSSAKKTSKHASVLSHHAHQPIPTEIRLSGGVGRGFFARHFGKFRRNSANN